MKFKREEILACFDAVAPGIANREVMAQAQSFVFYSGRVFTYNDRVAISTAMPKGWSITAAVKAKELHHVLRKFADEEIDVELDKNELVVTSPATQVRVVTEAEFARHHESIGEPKKWHTLPEGFNEALLRASFCASVNLSRPLLTFVHIKGDTVEAIDNERLLVQTIEADLPELMIPRDSVKDLVSFDCNKVGVTDGWVNFKNKRGVVYSTRTMDASEYPKLSDLLEVKGQQVQFPKEMKQGIDKARDVLDPKDTLPFVTISAAKNVLVVEARGPYASMKERYKVPFSHTLRFIVHPDLMDDALGMGMDCTVGATSIRIKSDEKHFVHVIALPTEVGAEPEPAAESEKVGKKTLKKGKK